MMRGEETTGRDQSGASTQNYSSFPFGSGFTREGGWEGSQGSGGCSASTEATQRTLPPALIPVKTSQQLIVHLLCKNSLKISRCLGTERHHQLQPLNCQAVAELPTLQVKQPPPQNRRWEITMGRKQEVFSSPSIERFY